MAEKAVEGINESFHDIKNLSDNEYQNLLDEAFSMTSVKLHDKSPILQKLLHEVKPDDDDLKASIKQKNGGSSVRNTLGKKRPERKRCKEEGKYSAASRTTQGGSLQNLNRKTDCGDVRGKNSLQKSGSLNCFALLTGEKLQLTKNSGISVCSAKVSGENMSDLNVLLEKKNWVKNSHTGVEMRSSYSSHTKNENIETLSSEYDYAMVNSEKTSSEGSDTQLICKDELVDVSNTSVNCDGELRSPKTRLIEMMELVNSDDENEHSDLPLTNLRYDSASPPRTIANCYSVSDQGNRFTSHADSSLIKNNAIRNEVDASISIPLNTKVHAKEDNFLPNLVFQNQPKGDLSSKRFGGDYIAGDAKGRSSLDVNGNPLSDAKIHSGFSLCAKKEGTEALDLAYRKSKRTRGTQKEMKAGDVMGNIGNLSIDELVEYITSADKKSKPAKNLLNDNKKMSLKNNKLHLPKVKKNEKENNKRNLHETEFNDSDVKGVVNSIETTQAFANVPDKQCEIFSKEHKSIKLYNVGREAVSCETRFKTTNHFGSSDNIHFSSCDLLQSGTNATSSCVELPNTVESLLSEDTGFHLVTKKQRRSRISPKSNNGTYCNKRVSRGVKRLDSDCDLTQFDWHYHQKEDIMLLADLPLSHCSQRSCIDSRRKSTSSVPPSDHSSIDNSDLDSVHSLPVKSTTVKPTLTKTSSSSSCTPQASYADIAKMSMHSLQRHQLPVSSLSAKRSTSLLTVEDDCLLDSLCGVSLDNKRDASTSTSEDGRSFIVQYEGSRSLSHAASYPSLAEASCLSNESNLAMQATSVSVTVSCETFYRINSACKSNTPNHHPLTAENTMKNNMPSEKFTGNPSENHSYKSYQESSACLDADENIHHITFADNGCKSDYDMSKTVGSYEGTKIHKSNSLDDSALSSASFGQGNSSYTNVTETNSCVAASVLLKKMEQTVLGGQERSIVKEKKKSPSNKSLPAVIILHKHEPFPHDVEVTFGFEINEQLLLMSDQKCEESAKDNSANATMNTSLSRVDEPGSVVMPHTGSADDCSELKFQNASIYASGFSNEIEESKNNLKMLDDSGTFNYSHVVHYITQTWNVVIQEFEAGHNLPKDQYHAKIQYYSGE